MYVYPFVAYKALHIYVLLETVTLQIIKKVKYLKRPWQDVSTDLLPFPQPQRRQVNPFPLSPPNSFHTPWSLWVQNPDC